MDSSEVRRKEHFCLCPQHQNDFGDIIKETIYRSRQVDKMESAAALVLCLQQVKLVSKGNHTPDDLWLVEGGGGAV